MSMFETTMYQKIKWIINSGQEWLIILLYWFKVMILICREFKTCVATSGLKHIYAEHPKTVSDLVLEAFKNKLALLVFVLPDPIFGF